MLILAMLAMLWMPGPVQTPSNLQAKKTVANAIAALGGDHYLQSNYRSGKGRLYTFGSTGDMTDPGTQFWSFYRFPNDERLELTKKRNVIYIYKGGAGWEITYKGVAPMLRKQLAQYANTSTHSLDVILKSWAADPKTLMLYQGLSMFDQEQVESVSFTTEAGDMATVDFDLTTHLPVRVHWRKDDSETGGHYEESVVYGNWVRIGAIETPFALDHFEGNQRQDQRFYTDVEFAPFSDALFTAQPLGKK